ncbi:hypothetical protein COEREDRAFT_95374 [Coemansia reversa NRRL 1564]|uniref:Uncharacterized protein n=1 Tax=Coemansia reversa (strain ATCC 12441 / NRRL 1564) TaxID=763665 RepID=A0A2G5BJQ5_COERN|nr:hypothetical protein COEREDRAFT_95374 [Coemansia reversa NRRL 1564]|eukprot:PIA19212.1 hypothetical protein COEREDRAFT_95374 [Coemansia reversa NRRL 1564]
MSSGEGSLGEMDYDVPATPTRRSARLASKRQLGDTPSTPTTASRSRLKTPMLQSAARIRATPTKSQSERRSTSRTKQATSKDLLDESPTIRPRSRSKLDPRKTGATSRTRATPKKDSADKRLASGTRATPKKEATSKTIGAVKRTARSTRSTTKTPKEETEGEDTKSRPPVHPDLEAAAKTLASLAGSRSSRTSSNASSSRQLVFADALKSVQQSDDDSDISDLSDVGDPHFASLMTAEAESATMSAAESAAGSVYGESDSEAPAALSKKPSATAATTSVSTARGLHTRFDNSTKADSSGEEEEQLGDTQRTVEGNSVAIEDESDSDEAPEVVTSKKPIVKTVVADANASKDETSKPNDVAAEPSTRAIKKRRARHRKRAATTEAAKGMSTVLANTTEQQKYVLGGLNSAQLPSEIPTELQLGTIGRVRMNSSTESSEEHSTENRLDASVLDEFGAESTKRKHEEYGTGAASRLKKKSKKNKKVKDRSSRVVSGIRVVAAKKPTKLSLLDMLAQNSISAKVRKFTHEKRGGSRIRRSVPLDAIAKRNNQPAINFLK